MEMGYKAIKVINEEGVATIILNRPEKMNALDLESVRELLRAIEEIGADETVRVVVLTGEGRAFCAGGDLTSQMYDITNPEELRKIIIEFGKVPINLRNLPKPVISAVNGAAVGVGLGFALSADIIIASEEARFGHAYANIGLMSDGGAIYFLPRLIGVSRACELMFTGKIIDAKEAERIGLVNQDMKEGIRAFKEKRPPIFKGR